MTLQERMIAVYLRQAKLPPEEKDKLKLFLGLLLETLEEEEPWERKLREDASAEQSRAEQSRAEQSRAEQSRAEQSRAEQSPPPETPATTFSVDPETPDGAASTSSAPVHGVDEKDKTDDPFSETLMEVMEKSSNDPFAEALLEALDKLGLKLDSKEAEKYFGIRCSVLQKALLGENIRKDSRARILQRVQDAGIAVTA